MSNFLACGSWGGVGVGREPGEGKMISPTDLIFSKMNLFCPVTS